MQACWCQEDFKGVATFVRLGVEVLIIWVYLEVLNARLRVIFLVNHLESFRKFYPYLIRLS